MVLKSKNKETSAENELQECGIENDILQTLQAQITIKYDFWSDCQSFMYFL